MINDLSGAFRTLLRNPGFTAVAVITLALGIGASTALFSVADAVLFKALPYPAPERIVKIESAPLAFTKTGFTAPRAMEDSRVFAGSGIYVSGGINVGGEPHAERVRAAAVSAGFFQAMGTGALLGRPFTREESLANAPVAVVSEALWRRRLNASPALDQPLLLNGRAFTTIGVMPRGFAFPMDAEVWVAAGADMQIAGGAIAPDTVARLAPGISLEQARQEVFRLKYEPGETPDPRDRPIVVTALRDELVGSVRPLFGIMGVAVSLVLLVACMNVGNLLLARVSAREREMSIRRALGASPWRLVRYLLAESGLIAGLAGLVAIPVAICTLQGMRLLLPPQLHNAAAIGAGVGLDGRAALVTALLCATATILFGLVPSLSTRARGASELLRTGTATASPFWRRFRGALVAGQLAAALILLAGSITIVKTVSTLLMVDLGASGENTLTLQLTLPRGRYDTTPKILDFTTRLDAQLRALPGVQSVGMSNMMVGGREMMTGVAVAIDGLPTPGTERPFATYLRATPEYFDALGIRLLAGRSFSPSDTPDGPRVAIVSEAVARLYGLEPASLIGRQFVVTTGQKPSPAEIVGVVRDVSFRGPESGAGKQLYVPFAQAPSHSNLYVAVKTAGDPRAMMALARTAVSAVDDSLPPYNVRTFDEIRASYVADRRFAMVLMLAFAGLTGVLAAIGLYGVMSYLVQLRVREIGIRVALGATPAGVLRETMRGGLTYAVPGIVIGTALAAILLRVFISRVPGLQQADAATLGLSAAGMLGLALVSTWIPAHRAGKINPVVALRGE